MANVRLYDLFPELENDIVKLILEGKYAEFKIKFEAGKPVISETIEKKRYEVKK